MMICRFIYTDGEAKLPVKVTTWDALGYYIYLPAKFIYHNEKELAWFPKIDSIYSLSGGELYQANRQKNGSYVFKYLEGVSLLQTPFFLIAHFIALHSDYPADGFSAPYQYAIAWGCMIYCLLALFLLRKILLRYYQDVTVAFTLILLLCASNFLQYTAIEGGQSHGYIFPLYVFLLYVTIQWHENRKLIWSFLMALIIGVAAISRPTEAVMLFIPLLWHVNTQEEFVEKFRFTYQHPKHIVCLIGGLVLGIFPQLLYWKRVTGSFIYDVGSKWDFLSPHFRVLMGWEKGWFIYTPVTLLFIAGLFLLKKQPFKRAVIIFCLLNIYIIISWHIWRYGGSYSCRALVQSYPVFSLALAGVTESILQKKGKWLISLLSVYLIAVNLFQIRQYNQGILHYDEMNRKYYGAIYLNPHPTPLDMSLLDTEDRLTDETKYEQRKIIQTDSSLDIHDGSILFDDTITHPKINQIWYKINAAINTEKGLWGSYLYANLKTEGSIQETKIRLLNPLTHEKTENHYTFYVKVNPSKAVCRLTLQLKGNPALSGQLNHLTLTELQKENP